MTAPPQQTRRTTTSLVWLLTALGLLLSATILGFVMLMSSRMVHQRELRSRVLNETNSLFSQLERDLRTADRVIEATLEDERGTTSPPPLWQSPEALLISVDRAFGAADATSETNRLKSVLGEISNHHRRSIDWAAHCANENFVATEAQRSVQAILLKFASELDGIAGQRRLQQAVTVYRQRTQPGTNLAGELADSVPVNRNATNVSRDLGVLQLLCENLAKEERIEHIDELCLNQILPRLERIRQGTMRIQTWDTTVGTGLRSLAASLEMDILGTTGSIYRERESVRTRKKGLGFLMAQRLALLEEGKSLRQEKETLFRSLSDTMRELDAKSKVYQDRLIQVAEKEFRGGWNAVLPIWAVLSAVFLALALRISGAVTHQVRVIESTNAELEAARDNALAAARAKADFLANMSHEIRTPLNATLGMAGLLLETELTPTQREYAEIVRSSGDALLSIINDILDFSKMESGRLEFECIDFDVRACVEEVGDLIGYRAHDKGLELVIMVSPQVPTRVKGDPGRLRQVLLNLVTNAVKFTEKGEVVIRVTLECMDERKPVLRFAVSDTGIGIPPDRMGRLFKSFSQVDASTTRKFGGTGLGLAICKHLVGMMGGEIKVDSEPGKGSTFSFSAHFQAAPAAEATEILRRTTVAGLRILVVDDNATNRQVFREMLRGWGCSVVEAADAREALATLQRISGTPDDVQIGLLDYNMPEMSGEDLARAIKSDPALARMPLILLTSSPRSGDARTMSDAGFSAYLTKPCKSSYLYDSIATLMGSGPALQSVKARPLVTQHTLNEERRRRARILVTEDNPVNQKVAIRMLQNLGYSCDVAANGLEAVQALERATYDVVFMDCQMPEMDGYEATRRIRETEGGGRHTTIIAMTAEALSGAREECLAAGMDDYVSKPIQLSVLQSILEKHLQSDQCETEVETLEIPGTSPAAGAESEPEPFDFQRLNDTCGDDVEFRRELITIFLSECGELFEGMATSIESGDTTRLRREAHTLKGAAANLGAKPLSEAAHRMQVSAEQSDAAAQWPPLLKELEGERQRLEKVLRRELGQ